MAQKIKKMSKKFIAFVCMITLVFSYSIISVNDSKAANATLVSDTLSDSRPTILADHVIKFKMDAATTIANTETVTVQFTGYTSGTSATVIGDWTVSHDADGSGAYTDLTPTTDWTFTDGGTSTADPTYTFTFTSAGETAIGTNKYIQIALTNGTNKLANPAASVCTINIAGTWGGSETGVTKVAIISGVAVSATVSESLTFSINAVASSTTIKTSVDTTVATTVGTAVDFGTLSDSANTIAAHQLSVSTNGAGGYTTTVEYTAALTSPGSDTITDDASTNTSPEAFSAAGTEGWGYTTNDAVLGTGTTGRFGDNNVWAGFTTTASEVAYSATPVSTETTYVGYQAGISGTTEAGVYTTTLVYITTPIF